MRCSNWSTAAPPGAPWPAHRVPGPRLQGRTVPAATQTWRSPPPLSNPRAAAGFLLPDSFPTEYADGFTTFTPSIATTPFPHTSVSAPSPLSRPLEDCEGCPVLAGVRNLGLDDPSAGVQIYIANSASAAAGPRRAAAARRAGSAQAGVCRPNYSSGRMAGACAVRGTWWRACTRYTKK